MFPTALQELTDDSIVSLSRRELEARVAAVRGLRGTLDAYEARVLVAIERLDDGGLDSAGVLRSRGGASSKRAMRAAKTAVVMDHLPATAAALADGRITAEHADAVADAAATTTPELADSLIADRDEAVVVEPADVFAKRTREWTSAQPTPDDGRAVHERQRRNRVGMITTDRESGMGVFRFELDPTSAARARRELEHLATQMWHDDGGRGAEVRTARTKDQRLADAFLDLITGAKADARKVRHPKTQVNLNIDISAATLPDGTPIATMVADGSPLPEAVKAQLACIAGFSVTLFDGPSRPIWVGRDHRHATIAQWRALIARDRGCVGCGASPDRCEAHHIVFWDDFGPTDIDNLVLVCSRCHHDLHGRGQQLVQEANGRWTIRPPELRLAGAAAIEPDARCCDERPSGQLELTA